jgi:hypothetical protein
MRRAVKVCVKLWLVLLRIPRVYATLLARIVAMQVCVLSMGCAHMTLIAGAMNGVVRKVRACLVAHAVQRKIVTAAHAWPVWLECVKKTLLVMRKTYVRKVSGAAPRIDVCLKAGVCLQKIVQTESIAALKNSVWLKERVGWMKIVQRANRVHKACVKCLLLCVATAMFL